MLLCAIFQVFIVLNQIMVLFWVFAQSSG